MHFINPNISTEFVKKYICFALLLFTSSVGCSQNTLEKESFETMEKFLDNHKNTDTLYFDYLKAYENKAKKNRRFKKNILRKK